MYVYHKAAFTFEVIFSTLTYAKWMCFNFTHSLMDFTGSIYLHNTLQTFSLRITWQLRALKAILVLNTIHGKNKKKLKKNCEKKKLIKETQSHLPRLVNLRMFLWKMFISPR